MVSVEANSSDYAFVAPANNTYNATINITIPAGPAIASELVAIQASTIATDLAVSDDISVIPPLTEVVVTDIMVSMDSNISDYAFVIPANNKSNVTINITIPAGPATAVQGLGPVLVSTELAVNATASVDIKGISTEVASVDLVAVEYPGSQFNETANVTINVTIPAGPATAVDVLEHLMVNATDLVDFKGLSTEVVPLSVDLVTVGYPGSEIHETATATDPAVVEALSTRGTSTPPTGLKNTEFVIQDDETSMRLDPPPMANSVSVDAVEIRNSPTVSVAVEIPSTASSSNHRSAPATVKTVTATLRSFARPRITSMHSTVFIKDACHVAFANGVTSKASLSVTSMPQTTTNTKPSATASKAPKPTSSVTSGTHRKSRIQEPMTPLNFVGSSSGKPSDEGYIIEFILIPTWNMITEIPSMMYKFPTYLHDPRKLPDCDFDEIQSIVFWDYIVKPVYTVCYVVGDLDMLSIKALGRISTQVYNAVKSHRLFKRNSHKATTSSTTLDSAESTKSTVKTFFSETSFMGLIKVRFAKLPRVIPSFATTLFKPAATAELEA
ncbi:hypothetical protein HDU76_004274 [Blyttiomyces sp. JEL0837]|nr:hypothetical protein HDU76_004274 [Blyttiomyces sp. JEL0837]